MSQQKDPMDNLKAVLAERPGSLVIISGPSAGAGKGKVISELLHLGNGRLWRSVSMTTRAPRADDQPRHTYYFVTLEAFAKTEAEGGFLEANGVTEGQRYGTPIEPLVEHLRAGMVVILEIEIYGARFVHNLFPEVPCFFIKPTDAGLEDDLAELRRRLTGRGTNDEASVERRLEQAAGELRTAEEFGFYEWIINAAGKSEEAAQQIYDRIKEQVVTP